MKRSTLFNKKSREDLKESLKAESFKRITASFYKYFTIDDPNSFSDMMYLKWDDLDIFGRKNIFGNCSKRRHNSP